MELFKAKNCIEQIDYLIQQEHTGTADEFAIKLGVSERTIKIHLRQLRECGVKIIYNRFKRIYTYTEEGCLYFGFVQNEQRSI